MNVEIKYGNGETLNPVYSPEHKDSVIQFYKELIASNKVSVVTITMDNGEVITMVEG